MRLTFSAREPANDEQTFVEPNQVATKWQPALFPQLDLMPATSMLLPMEPLCPMEPASPVEDERQHHERQPKVIGHPCVLREYEADHLVVAKVVAIHRRAAAFLQNRVAQRRDRVFETAHHE
jgi:hypothetical protein